MSEPRTKAQPSARRDSPVATNLIEDELEGQQSLIQQLGRLAEAISAHTSLDDLCKRLLELGLDAAGAALGVIRVRDAAQLRARAALGLDEEVTDAFTVPTGAALAGMEPVDG